AYFQTKTEAVTPTFVNDFCGCVFEVALRLRVSEARMTISEARYRIPVESRSPPSIAVGKPIHSKMIQARFSGRQRLEARASRCLSPAEAGLKKTGPSFPRLK